MRAEMYCAGPAAPEGSVAWRHMPEIISLVLADPPALWAELGFVTAAGACWISGICHELGAPGTGVVAWRLRGAGALSELPEADGTALVAQPTPEHPNGVIALDHVVIATPDLVRTIGAFESAGIPIRRTRDAGSAQQPMMQVFFKLGETIVEVVGSATESRPGKASFYGLAFTVADLEKAAYFLGERLRPARDAVQPGRRIASLDRAAGSTIPLAFMSPNH
jgi:hypothetical protein